MLTEAATIPKTPPLAVLSYFHLPWWRSGTVQRPLLALGLLLTAPVPAVFLLRLIVIVLGNIRYDSKNRVTQVPVSPMPGG